MAKKLKNPITLNFEILTDKDGASQVQSLTAKVHYGIECTDCGESVRRWDAEVPIPQDWETSLISKIENSLLPWIKSQEGIS